MSTLAQHDVDKGRSVLNFSEWGLEQATTESMVESISKGQRHLPYYVMLYPEAELSKAELGRLINGLIETTSQDRYLDAGEIDRPEK